ncbi:DUF2807 domain-containing protein [uncultured Lacinutrix sp.]|uniref:GIN domain-containing protein n=1 Tax=uncultured Lacinutrix sp. TaxID=574032 RepID=UPI00261BBD59|nr:DUF2807 domain-containing protein [uncultured Lacinutrix sp.]
MKNLKYCLVAFLISAMQLVASQTEKAVNSFNKVVISPHIEAVLVEGNTESVLIKDNTLTDDIVNIEVKGKTLRVYLDDAKEVTKTETVIKNGIKQQVPIYKNKVLTVEITYKTLEVLSIRGEQKTQCKSSIKQDDFSLKIYGESQVVLDDVVLSDLDIVIYGESQLMIKKGTTNKQKIIAYGESNVNLLNVENKTSKLRAYGEAEFKINASEEIKITAYGDATLEHKGNASIKRGIAIGDIDISQID